MDDWSLPPSRNAESEPAPNPQSTMTTTTLRARITRPRQAPPTGAEHPWPEDKALDPAELARHQDKEAREEPRNPRNYAAFTVHPNINACAAHEIPASPLDTSRPFMDDTGTTTVDQSSAADVGPDS